MIFALAALALASCQKNGLEDGHNYNDGTIRYAVVMNGASDVDATGTKAAGPDAGIQSGSQLQYGTVATLNDLAGSLSIPMELEVTDGICKPSGAVATKGTLVNTSGADKGLGTFSTLVGSFVTKAYDENDIEKVSQTVSWIDGAWVGSPVAYWPQSTSLNFFAYANLPSSPTSQSASIDAAGVSTIHTVPAAASNQTDILFGHYQGDGGNTGTAQIRFDHPMTAVRFLYGEITGSPSIKSISLEGVAESGKASMALDGTISWSGVSSYTHTVSQTNASGLPLSTLEGYEAKLIGEPFIIIPQNLGANSVTVKVTFMDNSVVYGTLDTRSWDMQKTNTYTLGYQDEWDYVVEGMEPVTLAYTGGSSSMSVKSYRENRMTHVMEPVAWNLEYSTDGTNWSSTKPAWLSFNRTSGTGGTTGEALTATISAQSGEPAGQKDVKTEHDANLKAATPKGTADNRFDLSYYNVATGQVTTTRSTANTYVVNASGYYKFPLVYGNAIKNGVANTEAYIAPPPSNPGTYTHYLQNFVNHADKNISDPWIKSGQNANGSTIGTDLNACIVWQDANNLVSNVRIDGDYLTFDVANSTITQGNCMIAVRNGSNTILWSWQIWVTDENLAETNKVTISGEQFDFMKVLLGWYSIGKATVTSYAGRECYVRATNSRGNSSALMKQLQHEDVNIATKGSCTMYQWGRKDPIPGGDGGFVNIWRGLYQNTYNARIGSSDNLEWFSIGTAIQQPYYMNFKYDSYWDWNPNYFCNLWNNSIIISDEEYETSGYDFNQHKVKITRKTIYDPSPVGFKIPHCQAYEGIAAQESGHYSYDADADGYIYSSPTGNIFFPCCRYRNTAYMGSDSRPYWDPTPGFSIWSTTPAHSHTSFELGGEPQGSFFLNISNANRPYALAVALITE